MNSLNAGRYSVQYFFISYSQSWDNEHKICNVFMLIFFGKGARDKDIHSLNDSLSDSNFHVLSRLADDYFGYQ